MKKYIPTMTEIRRDARKLTKLPIQKFFGCRNFREALNEEIEDLSNLYRKNGYFPKSFYRGKKFKRIIKNRKSYWHKDY